MLIMLHMHFSKMASASLWSHELLTFPRLHEEAKATSSLGSLGGPFVEMPL